MAKFFQDKARILVAAFALAALAQHAATAGELKSKFFGRWTVDDPTDKFSPNGKLYRVVDIAPCGKDFCGVSVNGGACGVTLFRFLAIHASNENLSGHGLWGGVKKNLAVSFGLETANGVTIALGNADMDPSPAGRSGSAPTFQAVYHRISDAACQPTS